MRYFLTKLTFNNHVDWRYGTRQGIFFAFLFTPKIWALKIKLGWKG